MPPKPKTGMTLGQYLRQVATAAGLSYRGLAAASGVSHPAIQRLMNDDVNEPLPTHLVKLAEALDIRASDLFMLAGLPILADEPSVDIALRAEYNLSDEGVAEAKEQIARIAAQERAKRHSNED